ncbi:MAG: hypothetical protein FWF59_03620 [Turicibacter sp.]|nr:hypothetical protein [Turicibacter sp.]
MENVLKQLNAYKALNNGELTEVNGGFAYVLGVRPGFGSWILGLFR